MNKQEFISKLQTKLKNIPSDAVNEQINFYIEIIEDKIEDGKTEEEAINEIGSIDEISENIISNISIFKIAKEKLKPNKKLKVWEIILIILGSPIWLPLFIAFLAIFLSIYISVWAIIISFYAIFIAFSAATVAATLIGLYLLTNGNGELGLIYLSVSLVCFGISMLMFVVCKYLTKGIVKLSKSILHKIKKVFIRKDANNHEN